jgi:hypothetical protein
MNSADGGAEPATPAGAGVPAHLELLEGGRSLASEVSFELERQRAEHDRLWQVIERINQGVGVEEILDFIYDEFRGLVPFNRMSYAVVEGATGLVVAKWTRSDGESAATCSTACA